MHATIVQSIDQRAQKYCKQHANVCMHKCAKHEHMQFNVCMLQWSKQLITELCMNMCIHVCVHTDISPMHATIVQAIDQRVQIYAIQLIHATIIETIDHSVLHKHMQFNLCMLQSSKHAIKELLNIEKTIKVNINAHNCSKK